MTSACLISRRSGASCVRAARSGSFVQSVVESAFAELWPRAVLTLFGPCRLAATAIPTHHEATRRLPPNSILNPTTQICITSAGWKNSDAPAPLRRHSSRWLDKSDAQPPPTRLNHPVAGKIGRLNAAHTPKLSSGWEIRILTHLSSAKNIQPMG